eukprot:c5267_g1_i1 orf=192-713(+)
MFRFVNDDLQSIQFVTHIQSLQNVLPDLVPPAHTPIADDQGVGPDPSHHESKDYDQPASEEDISPHVHYDQPEQLEICEIKAVVGDVPQDVPKPVPTAEEVGEEVLLTLRFFVCSRRHVAASIVATQLVQVKVTPVHGDRFISQFAPAAATTEPTAEGGLALLQTIWKKPLQW